MTQETHEPVVEHDEAGHRYVLRIDGEEAGELGYSLDGDRVVMEHTVVDRSRREKGLGSRLAAFALDDARTSGRRVVPQCPFVAAYVADHPEHADLVD